MSNFAIDTLKFVSINQRELHFPGIEDMQEFPTTADNSRLIPGFRDIRGYWTPSIIVTLIKIVDDMKVRKNENERVPVVGIVDM